MDGENEPLLYDKTNGSKELEQNHETSSSSSSSSLSSLLLSSSSSSIRRKVEHPTTNTDTLIHLVKANIGIGILAMPNAFKNASLYVGLVCTLAVGFICTYCMNMLLRCANELCHRLNKPSMDFSEVSYYAFETGPPRWRKYSNSARTTINCFLCVTQLGICCVYLVFVAVNLKDVVEHYHSSANIRYYLLGLLIPMILLNFLKNLKFLVPVSIAATILSATGLSIIFYFIIKGHTQVKVGEPIPWKQLPLFFGTAIGSFEGIAAVLPLQNNMKTPEAFGGLNGVLTTGMTIVAALYTSIGFYGYLIYGQEVEGSITLNLDQNSPVAESARVLFALSIFLSCGLQFYIPLEIVGPKIRSFFPRYSPSLVDGILRVTLVLISFLLAIAIPKLEAIISLIGAFGSSSLALIFPPILDILTFGWNGMGRFYWKFWTNLAIVAFGTLSLVSGTYVSILEIVKS